MGAPSLPDTRDVADRCEVRGHAYVLDAHARADLIIGGGTRETLNPRTVLPKTWFSDITPWRLLHAAR